MKLTNLIRSLTVVILIAVALVTLAYASPPTEIAPAGTTAGLNWVNYTNPNDVRSLAWEGNYVWAGTTGGVVRWNVLDGSYHIYTTADGLAGNFVAHTAVDGFGNKWFDTAHGGIYGGASPGSYGVSQFNGASWTTHSNWPSGSEPHNVTSFAIDFSGNLWAGTRGAGAYEYDGNTWTAITETDGLAGNTVLAITLGGDGHLWFATDAGISESDQQGWTTYTYSNDAVAIAVDGESIWVATADGVGRLVIADGTYTKFDVNDGLISNDVRSVAVDWNERVWFGTDAGVSIFDQGSWTSYTASDGLAPGTVWAVTVDGRGHVWLGTSAGLTEYDNGFWNIYQLPQAPSSNYVDALLPESPQAFWAAVGASWESYGLAHFDGNSWTAYGTSQGLPDGNVDAIAKGKNGHLWAGTHSGIVEYDGSLWKTHTIPSAGNEIYDIIVNSASGHLWIATNAGAAEYDGSLWNTYKTSDGLVNNNVKAIALDGINNVWFGTSAGVSRLSGGSWTTFTTSNGLVSNSIVDIAVDHLNRIWFATSSGVSVYDNGAWDTFTEANSSLASNVVQSIVADSQGGVWIGTQSGVNRLYQGDWSTFTCEDGLADDDVHAVAVGSDGSIWFGTDSGISRLTISSEVYLPIILRAK